MGVESYLRDLQDARRDSGWEIRHIPWQEQGRLEILPNTFGGNVLILLGLGGFLGGIALMVGNRLPVLQGIGVSVAGLVLLMLSRYVSGYLAYRNFVPVTARCIDSEIRRFEDREPGQIGSTVIWVCRILCEFSFEGGRYQVTPILTEQKGYKTRDQAEAYLLKRMDQDGTCTLWVDPDNPLHTMFHRKARVPMTV